MCMHLRTKPPLPCARIRGSPARPVNGCTPEHPDSELAHVIVSPAHKLTVVEDGARVSLTDGYARRVRPARRQKHREHRAAANSTATPGRKLCASRSSKREDPAGTRRPSIAGNVAGTRVARLGRQRGARGDLGSARAKKEVGCARLCEVEFGGRGGSGEYAWRNP